MEVVKLSLIAIIFAILIVYLSGVNKEISALALVAASGIFLIVVSDGLAEVLGLYNELAALSGITDSILKTVVKITLICYVSEFAIGLIEDFGLKSLADKLSVAAKILIVVAASPVLKALISSVSSLVG